MTPIVRTKSQSWSKIGKQISVYMIWKNKSIKNDLNNNDNLFHSLKKSYLT